MQLQRLVRLFAASFGVTLLAACGGSDSDNGYTPPPPPDPGTFVFQQQVSPPALLTIDNSGTIFSAENGLSLYFFANDENGLSNCNGVQGDEPGSTTDATSCAGRWPPLLAVDGAVPTTDFTFVERSDGTQQWSFKGYALYTFADDSAQGDTSGDGVGGVWDLARPMPLKISTLDNIATYTANQTILSATSVAGALEAFRAAKDGFVLYIFDNDALDTSACNSEGCINTWPPIMADNGAKPDGMLSLIDRVEGEQQWAYKGKALYLFAGDTAAGEQSGDNVNDVWHSATQEPAIIRTNSAGTMLTATGLVSALLPNSANGDALEPTSTDKEQFTLYTFDNDETQLSNCNDACAVNWPAFLISDNERNIGDFSQFDRADGTMQWAYKQQPLYFFSGDSEKAQANGDGLGGVWHIVEPAPVVTPITTSIIASASAIGQSLATEGEVLVLMDNGSGEFMPTVADKSGFQLYIFDSDTSATSNCISNTCMTNWPALLASETDSASPPFSIFTRDDGNQQWALNSMPLYFFAGDSEAGQQNGEAVGDVWFVARPAPLRLTALTSNSATVNGFIGHGDVLASQGKTVAELTGLTLYTFDNDVVGSGESTCFDSCAVTWPPLYASSAEQAFAEWQIIERTESDASTTLQWTYQGQPLYFYEFDLNLGDTTGVYGAWHIALP